MKHILISGYLYYQTSDGSNIKKTCPFSLPNYKVESGLKQCGMHCALFEMSEGEDDDKQSQVCLNCSPNNYVILINNTIGR